MTTPSPAPPTKASRVKTKKENTMAHQCKRHYGTYGDSETTLCGLSTTAGHMLANGAKHVHKITCKTCQRVLAACLNVGDDKWVEYDNDRLTLVN